MSSSVKTAISLAQPLFDEVNHLASELNVSRSKVFVLAVEDYIKNYENKKMLLQINETYSDLTNEDQEINNLMKCKHHRMIENEKW